MIVLIGFMGAGKSTVGACLADRLAFPFRDVDALVVERAGQDIPSLFASEGEASFRERERAVALDLLSGDEAVVALGGGALGDEMIRTAVKGHTTVFLSVSLEEALRRIDPESRPMLSLTDPEALYDERHPEYERTAQLRVDTDGRDVDDVVDEVVAFVHTMTRPVRVRAGEHEYPVVVGRGILRHAATLFGFDAPRRMAVVHQPNVEGYAKEVGGVLEAAGSEVFLVEVADREDGKDLRAAEALWTQLVEAGLQRDDAMVTVGGGAISDAGGFVASTILRGIRVVHVPTTLLGQVDAAIGGKTALNLPQGKNLVGTIHQPIGVICDVDTLATLDVDELRSGCAEVVKYGFISHPGLLELLPQRAPRMLAADPVVLEGIVERCAAAKAEVVSEDADDSGRRKILNYGHTFGHAFEQRSGFEMRHGDAVSIGMVAAALTAQELGWLDDDAVSLHRDTLDAFGLPIRGDYELDQIRQALLRDKKSRGAPRFVLLREIGDPRTDVEVPEDVLSNALARLSA